MTEKQKWVSYWYGKEMCLVTTRTLRTRTPRRRPKKEREDVMLASAWVAYKPTHQGGPTDMGRA
eukprot:10703347-Heterocapsa_arctica.AAC.1